MLGPIVLAILVAGARVGSTGVTEAAAAQQPSASPVQTTAEKPWPPPGVVRAGVGDVAPRVIKETRAGYLPMAMKEKITGVIGLKAVVETDGTVSRVRVTRSLDRKFGMDDEAVRVLKEWQFAPGKRDGIAVPMLVDVEMAFSIRK